MISILREGRKFQVFENFRHKKEEEVSGLLG